MLSKAVFLDRETVDHGDLDFRALAGTIPTWKWHQYSAPAQVTKRVTDADLIITNKCRLNVEVLSAALRLKLIVLVATGTDNVDLSAARQRKIVVCNIRNYATAAVALHTITLMLNLLTGQPWYWNRVRAGDWSRARQFCLYDRPIRELGGLQLGIIGAGVLGQAVAAKAAALGLEVMLAEHKGRDPREGRTAFEDVVARADILSIHCPLNEATLGMIDRQVMRRMKEDAVIINTARGGIVDEEDLAECLREGVIGGAAVDTLSVEPPPPDHPLLAGDIPNLLITPHNAWASQAARQAAIDQLVSVIEAYQAGNAINRVA